MLFIYYLKSGEIYQASIPEKNLKEFFGENHYEEMSKVFGSLYIKKFDNFIFYNFKKFKVENEELVIKNNDEFLFNLEGLNGKNK